MKVLVIASIAPYPKNVGKRIMLGGICDYLRQANQVADVKVASFAKTHTPELEEVTELSRPSALRKLFNVLFLSLLSQRKSLQESFFWSPRAARELRTLIHSYQPDVIVYDTLRTGQYLSRPSQQSTHVIYLDDLFSVRYRKMLAAIEAHSLDSMNAMGNFKENIPRPLLKLYSLFPALQTVLLKIERRLIAASEDRAPEQFDRALLVSSAEKNILAERTGADNVFTLPPRIEAVPSERRKWNGRPEFVFVGSLVLAHNTLAIESFLETQMPELIQRIPDVHLSIIGKGANDALKALAARFESHVSLLGFVDDLDDVLLRACASIAPLTFGSGVKLKVIDTLRCGVPLVTTSQGIEGVETADSSGILLVDDVAGFPAAMQSLLDPARNAQGSEANRDVYQRYYSLAVVDRLYRQMFVSHTHPAQGARVEPLAASGS